MRSHVRWDCLLKGVEKFAGIATVLGLISIGLLLYAQQIHELASIGILFIASWILVLSIACLAVIPVLLLVRAKTSCG